MRYIAWNMTLAAWLLASAFAFGHTPESAAVNGLLAVLVGTFSLASQSLPGLRFANSAFALLLGWAALLMPDVSAVGRINTAVVAAVVFALSVVPGRATGHAAAQPERATGDGHAAPQPHPKA
jgi:hypothetical protein